ncbi:MAG: VWA domain-containing protein [Promethearchaeia archaeon]
MSEEILGTYDLEKKVEDICVVLENTEKNYGDPDIVVEIEAGLLSMISTKLAMESKTRFALVTFSNRHEVRLDFEDFSQEVFKEALYNIELSPSNKASIDVGMNSAFQVVVKSMQKLAEGKRFRIIMVSDGKFEGKGTKWQELVNISEKVGIYIDCIQLNPHYGQESNILEKIAKRTDGTYYNVNDISQMEAILTEVIPAKVQEGDNKFQSQEDRNLKGLLEVIAVDMVTVENQIKTVEQLKELLDDESEDMKCGICRMHDCAVNGAPAFSCGMFCPQCDTFYHSHCVSGWAESQKETPKTVFKCPVCFHLLKVPGSLQRIKVLNQKLKENQREPIQKGAKKFNINEIGPPAAYKFCSWCRNVFKPDEEVYSCNACGAFYHASCMDEMSKKTMNRCRVCDAQLGKSRKKSKGIERII